MTWVLGPSLFNNQFPADGVGIQDWERLVSGEDVTDNLGDESGLLHNRYTAQVKDSKGGQTYQVRTSVILKRFPDHRIEWIIE